MKKLSLSLFTLVSLMVSSCSCSNNSSFTPVSPFKDMIKAPEIEINHHEFREKKFVDFPELTPTAGLTYTLVDNVEEPYYIVDNGMDVMQLVNDTLVIPSTHNNRPVKEIHHNGFLERTWIKGLYIPSTIEVIENETFSMCGLENIYWDAVDCNDFPERNGIFHPATDEEQRINLVIGPHVKKIPARLMLPSLMTPNVNPRVDNLSFSKNSVLEEIGDYAFYGLNMVNRLDLPETVKKIGKYAFYGLNATELDLNSVESIGEGAFRFNSSLEYIDITNVTSIGEYTFETCPKLKYLDNQKITSIPFAAFKDDTKLEKVLLGDNVTIIDGSAFEGCSALEIFNLPKNTVTVGEKAFKDCASLTHLDLDSSLRYIGEEAFANLNKLETLAIRSTNLSDLPLNNKVFTNLSKDKGVDIYIDKDVTRLPTNFFYPSAVIDRLPKINTIYCYSAFDIGSNAFLGQESIPVIFDGIKSSFNNKTVGEGNDAFFKNMVSRG